MQYFVTGATGFIGKRLVRKLLGRKGATVHFLIRKESEGKVAALREYWGVSAARAVPVFGDLTSRRLGVAADPRQPRRRRRGLAAGDRPWRAGRGGAERATPGNAGAG